MLDATGKLPAGILEGNRYSFGSYLECSAITPIDGVQSPQLCDLVIDSVFFWSGDVAFVRCLRGCRGVCLPPVCVDSLVALLQASNITVTATYYGASGACGAA